MPLLTIHHVTAYRYKQPVSLGEHRIMMRPREAFDQRLLSARLSIDPQPGELRWVHDVLGNSVAIASFERRASQLVVSSEVTLEHAPIAQKQVDVEAYARLFPFTYSSEDMPDLLRSIERQHLDLGRVVDNWARAFVSNDGNTGTIALLTQIATSIQRDFTYVPRHEKGTQTPIETLKKRQGTCRDFAVLMIEAVRALGFAARFVSGYVYNPSRSEGVVGGGNTHAWVRIFLPGSGWVEFDPTNGIIGNRGLIRVAVARDPYQALPLSGTWYGLPASFLGMDVTVDVRRADPAQFPLTDHGAINSRSLGVSGKVTPMLIRCGYDIRFESDTKTAMMAMLSLHPSRHQDLQTPQRLFADPDIPLYHFEDGFGNVATRLAIPPGGVTLSSDFVIEDSGEPDARAPDGPQTPVEDLPDAVMPFLLGSRYCETDRLMDVAWSNFGNLASARDRVDAIVTFVHNHIEFGYHYARPDKTAWNGYQEKQGVCRDFAHLAITLCRCMNIPARYCTGYLGDIGVPPVDAPMDFSAWFDVYIDGEWYTHDARHNKPRIGRILMARGRDATDVALTTAFGPANLVRFEVITDEVDSID